MTTTDVTGEDAGEDTGEDTGILPETLAGICTMVTGEPAVFGVVVETIADCMLKVSVAKSTATAAHKVIVLETPMLMNYTVHRSRVLATFKMPYESILR